MQWEGLEVCIFQHLNQRLGPSPVGQHDLKTLKNVQIRRKNYWSNWPTLSGHHKLKEVCNNPGLSFTQLHEKCDPKPVRNSREVLFFCLIFFCINLLYVK